ncbi:MAG: CHAT domain-containing tetratricopeptide repeat protein, partial [Cyanobacteria bacterium]|nr:CHAT domain-containing tetratricopeptide repeat protein [Cyanobacteriota bacterium]
MDSSSLITAGALAAVLGWGGFAPAASATLGSPQPYGDWMPAPMLAQDLDRPRQSGDPFQRGLTLFQQGQLAAAREAWEQALDQYERAGDRPQMVETQIALGVVNDSLGNYRAAANYLIAARDTARALGLTAAEARAINTLGLVRVHQGRYEEALALYEEALAMQRQLGNRNDEAIGLNNLGQLYGELGDYERATRFLEQALALHQQLGNTGEIVTSLNNLGAVAGYQGRLEASLVYYEQALALADQLDDRLTEARLLGNIGLTYVRRGQYPPALAAHERALAIALDLGTQSTEMVAYNNLGLLYDDLGQWQLAADYFDQALALSRRLGDRDAEGTFLGNLAGIYDEQGDKERAIDLLEEALAITRSVGNPFQEAVTLNNLGTVYDDLNRYAPALAAYDQALTIVETIGSRYVEGRLRSNIGFVYAQQGDLPRARQFFIEALAITRETGDGVGQARVWSHLANVEFEAGDHSQAETILGQAIALLEALQGQDLSDSDRVALLDTQRTVYNRYQTVLIAQGKTTAALTIAEQGRARAFAALLALRTGNAQAEVLPQAPNVAAIQRIARDQQATLVEYSVIPEDPSFGDPQDGTQLYIWVVQPTGDITFRQRDLAATDVPLDTLVNQTRGEVGAGLRGLGIAISTPGDSPRSYRALHDQLIAPIADLLPTDPTARVVFIPQDELFQVPFAALQRPDGSYLIQHHTPLTAPSIQVLGLLPPGETNPPQGATALVVGNPAMPQVWSPQQGRSRALDPLPGAQQEAEAIAPLLNAHALVGNAATEARVKAELATADIIHLATHGLLEYGQVQDSGVRDLPGA